jgi:hypothetical protein
VQLVGNIYSGYTPDTLSSQFIALRVLATDASGNALDYRAEPAFHIGSYINLPPSASNAVYPANKDTIGVYFSSQQFVFRWAKSQNPETWQSLTYGIHIRGPVIGLNKGIDASTTDTSMTFSRINLQPDTTYRWWITTSDGYASVTSDTAWFRTTDTILGVDDKTGLPKEFALYQNYPNPFNPTTTIRYDLPKESYVLLKVYNILGQEVATLVDASQRSGRYSTILDGSRLASGMYFYQLQAGTFVESKKLLLLR